MDSKPLSCSASSLQIRTLRCTCLELRKACCFESSRSRSMMAAGIVSVKFVNHTKHIGYPASSCHPGGFDTEFAFSRKSMLVVFQLLHSTNQLQPLRAERANFCATHCPGKTVWLGAVDRVQCQHGTGEQKQAPLCGLGIRHQRITNQRRQHSRVSVENRSSSVPPPSLDELQKQLESLRQEAEEVQHRAKSTRARFMRLSEAAEQLRLRAALDVRASREEDAVCLLKQKQKVMQALEISKRRAGVLDELYAKLNEAISRKETQLIAALSCARLDLRNIEHGSPDDARVVVPREPRIDARIDTSKEVTVSQQTTAVVEQLEEGIEGGSSGLLAGKIPSHKQDNDGNLAGRGPPLDSGEPNMVWTSDLLQQEQDSGEKTSAANDAEGLGELLYLGDVQINEEIEEPPTYVPPPPVAAEDIVMRKHVENLLYTLKEVLPGNLVKNEESCWAALELFSEAVEFQDPFFCFRGVERLQTFLAILAKSGAAVNLHDIYYESLVSQRFKRWVYCVMTVTLAEDLGDALQRLGLFEGWTEKHNALITERQWGKEGRARRGAPGCSISSDGTTPNLARALNLSGEFKLEMEKNGKVSSVNSTWYVMEDEGEERLAEAKLWLSLLLSSHFS